MGGAAEMLDDAMDGEARFCPGCGLELDPEDLWCGIDPWCRLQAYLMWGDDDR